MFRRAKLQLDAVPRSMVAKAVTQGLVLTADLRLTDRCGEPLCASVRPPDVRWSLTRGTDQRVTRQNRNASER